MKKLLFIALISLAMSCFADAQELGVRFGDVSSANNFAIDGIFSSGQFSRIHADLSFGDGGVGVDALWDFIYKPLGVESFNWYLGAGPYLRIDDPFWLGVAGEVGLEYKFKGVPIALGLDWRPSVSIIQDTDFHAGGFGLNIRYIIGKK
ncbi:MAG: outer membrane insertion C- signal [Bacteroidia bacterium]